MKKFNIAFIFLLCITTSKPSLADGFATAGAGYPYGGVAGARYSYPSGQNIYSVSLGLLGAAASYHRLLDDKNQHGLGIIAGLEVLSSEKGFTALSYQYYASGVQNRGWVLGSSLGLRRQDEGRFFGSYGKVETKALFGIDIGYRF